MKIPEKYIFYFIFIFSLTVLFAHLLFTKTILYSDNQYYYVYTRSLVKDLDINFANEYDLMKVDYTKNKYGLVSNKFAPGTGLLWTPLYLLTNTFLNTFESKNSPTTGFELPYQVSVSLSGIIFGILGLYFMHKTQSTFFNKEASIISTVLFFFSTNLLFYISIEPYNSHTLSFFASSIFVWFLIKNIKNQNTLNHYIQGMLGGLVSIVRVQDLPLTISYTLRFRFKKNYLKNALAFLLGFISIFSIQILVWKLYYDSFWYNDYLKAGFPYLKNPQFIHVLFNKDNGLMTQTPIMLVCLIPPVLSILKKHTSTNPLFKIYLAGLIYFTIQLYLISSWSSYFQGGSYSIRMIISTYPLIIFGLTYTIQKAIKKNGIIKTLLLFSVFPLLNIFMIFRYLINF